MSTEEEVYRIEDIKEGYTEPPVPYDEVKAEGEDWCEDYYDQAIPTSKGFITDFIYYTRGFETPTLSCIWTALFVLSSAIKREAWYQWAPGGLYTNQYIIIIGPAGIVKKTTAVSVLGLPILRKFRYWIQDRNMYSMKSVLVVKDKVTPEALLNSIIPENKDGHDIYLVDEEGNYILGVDGKAIRYKRTSEVALVVSELATMLGKASYADTMIPMLLDLYDCHNEWEWRTLTRGTKVLRNLHTSLLAGTTVDGLRSSIPASATGDGFLSRTIPVYVPDTKREYFETFIPKNAPSEDELAKRLAWIATHCVGEFRLTDEAKEVMKAWYKQFKNYLRNNPAIAGSMSRMDINVYKTALLMRAQRYDDTTPFITKEDLLNAIRLLDLTYTSFSFLRSQTSPDELTSWMGKVAVYLRKRKRVQRYLVMQRIHIRSDMLTAVIEEFLARRSVKVWIEDKEYNHASGRTTEEYEWIDEDDGQGDPSCPGEGPSFNYTKETWNDPPDGKNTGSKPHGPQAVPKRGRPRKPVQPDFCFTTGEEAPVDKPPKRKGRPPKVDGRASERKASKRIDQGHRESDQLHDRSGEDVLPQDAKAEPEADRETA